MFNLFSKRNKQTQTNKEIFTYDDIPRNFRIQVIHIWADAIGEWYHETDYLGKNHTSPSNIFWTHIHDQLCREYGILTLGERGQDPYRNCQQFIQQASTEQVLDIIELSFICIDNVFRNLDKSILQKANVTQTADDAIDELNNRFREHSIGYKYIEKQVVRVDSEYIFSEAIQPAILFLSAEEFEGASQEFMSAHEHFRKGRSKEAITDALKAFESVMKTICIRMGWNVRDNPNASVLIKTLFENGLISESLQSQFTSLQSTLSSGLPTIRNKNSAHGQGEAVVNLPQHLVAYALNLAATNILFLMESYKELNRN